MTQQDLLDYLLLKEHNCCVYEEKQKEDGVHYFIRNHTTRRIKIVYPVRKGTYSPAAVCDICNWLDVPVHPYGAHMQKALDKIKAATEEIPQHILDKVNGMKESKLNIQSAADSVTGEPKAIVPDQTKDDTTIS